MCYFGIAIFPAVEVVLHVGGKVRAGVWDKRAVVCGIVPEVFLGFEEPICAADYDAAVWAGVEIVYFGVGVVLAVVVDVVGGVQVWRYRLFW